MSPSQLKAGLLFLALLTGAVQADAWGHPNQPGQSLGRKMLTALSAAATDAANAANIWPPRDPVGTGCYGAYCGGGNYGYTQAVPAGGGPGNNFYTPDGYIRPVPLARPMVAG